MTSQEGPREHVANALQIIELPEGIGATETSYRHGAVRSVIARLRLALHQLDKPKNCECSNCGNRHHDGTEEPDARD